MSLEVRLPCLYPSIHLLTSLEFDLLTGKTLFEWSTADNIPPSVSYNELPGDRDEGTTSLNAWDYFHLNSIDKDSHGDYIISASEASSIFKISRESGDIIWTLGGKLNQFILGPGVAFSGQHHVRVLDNHPYYGLTDHEREAGITILSLFDNLGDMEAESAITRGKIIKLDIDSMTASLLTSFNQDDDTIIGYHGGSIQVLEEGGAFITYAETAQLRTFSHDGSITFAATIDPNAANFTGVILNYRGYIYPPYLFYSAEPIAAIAYYGEAFSDLQGARIFVSWNGDTATKYWRVWGYGAEGQGSKGYLVWWGHERQGFETKIAVEKNKWTSFVIEALDEEAQSLGKSEMIYLEDFVAEYKEPVVSEPETGVNDTKGEKSTRPASWRTPGELKA